MDIHLVESGLEQRCPLCRDDLPAERAAWAHCLACGTGYHAECSAWAAGCALLGCGGRFGAEAIGERFALVVQTGLTYDSVQIQAIADLMSTGVYDARLKLRAEVPWILSYSSREELDRRRAALSEAKVVTFAVEAARLAQGPEEVARVSLADGVLELLAELSGKTHRLDPSARPFVVLGRYEDQKATYPSPRVKLQEGPTGRQAARERSTTRFAHVYPSGGAAPFAVTADRIRDYRFLGERMQPSGVANFQSLIDLLCRGARVNDALLRRLTGRSSVVRKDSVSSLKTNRPWITAASCLLALTDEA